MVKIDPSDLRIQSNIQYISLGFSVSVDKFVFSKKNTLEHLEIRGIDTPWKRKDSGAKEKFVVDKISSTP